MGLYEGGKLRVPLPKRKKSFWLGEKKKVCSGEKTIAPLHVSSGPPLINGKPVKVAHSQLIQGIGLYQSSSAS